MAFETHTVTGDLRQMFGDAINVASTNGFVETNLANDQTLVYDLDNGVQLLGTGKLVIASDGAWSLTGVPSWDNVEADQNPIHVQIQVVFEYTDPLARQKRIWRSGYLEIDHDGSIGEFVAQQLAPADWRSAFMTEAEALLAQQQEISGLTGEDAAMATIAASDGSAFAGELKATIEDITGVVAVDHGSISGTLSVSDGAHEFTLTGALVVAVTGDVTLYAHGTGQVVTVAGSTITVNGDKTIAVTSTPRGVQRAYIVGGVVISATPATPTADDTANTYTLPTSTGVLWRIGGVLKAPGTYSVGNIDTVVTVVAEAAAGYVLSDPSPLPTWSWTFTFTQTVTWTTLVHDTFVGTNGDAIAGRTPDTVANSRTWSRVDAGASTTTIDTNRLKATTSGGTQAVQLALAAAPTTPATPLAVRITADYIGSARLDLRVPYFSTAFGSAQIVRYTINAGTLSATATGADNTAAALTAAPGKSLTGLSTVSGQLQVLIVGTSVKIYIDGVLIANGALPGSLKALTGAFDLTILSGSVFLDSYKAETGA